MYFNVLHVFDTESTGEVGAFVEKSKPLYAELLSSLGSRSFDVVIVTPAERTDLSEKAAEVSKELQASGVETKLNSVSADQLLLSDGKVGLYACTQFMLNSVNLWIDSIESPAEAIAVVGVLRRFSGRQDLAVGRRGSLFSKECYAMIARDYLVSLICRAGRQLGPKYRIRDIIKSVVDNGDTAERVVGRRLNVLQF